MKKIVVILISLIAMNTEAQESKMQPQINVSGEGKMYVTPDQAFIQVTIETRGKSATEIKQQNDEKTDAVLKFIKKINLPKEDYKTQSVMLNPQYDYETKKTTYYATQTIEILLKDLSKYDVVMEGIVGSGVSQINNIEFKSSKMVQLQSEARKLAMKDAKQKAEDYVSVLGQKVGKAIVISDNSQVYSPPVPMYAAMKSMDAGLPAANNTLAAGQIAIVANVTVSFSLE